ncbi:hypothetical protein [Fusobacterium mortiferum]|jgi:hypothetical protein|nr:hypothetical protein [Fusobacterium mortiferum]
MKRITKAENMEKIRLHNLKHNHVILLIHLGINPIVISKDLVMKK